MDLNFHTKFCDEVLGNMEETSIRNDAQMKKDVETSLKGKQEEHEEEKRVIHVLEETQGEDNSTKTNIKESRKNDGLKGPKKTNPKTHVTVPRPFNLATEKRMTRERRGSMDFKEPKPILAKSASFNHKPSNLKGTGSSSIKTSLKPKIQTNEKDAKNMEGTRIEKPTFKALPLPKFYRQKDPSQNSEAKKKVVGCSKPPVIVDLVKSLPKSGNNKIKVDTRRVSKGTNVGAKETIIKVIKTTKNSLKTAPKDTTGVLVGSDGK
ncbi:hypothetical protein LXL04_005445 [Taraxacum kok-saghyz]